MSSLAQLDAIQDDPWISSDGLGENTTEKAGLLNVDIERQDIRDTRWRPTTINHEDNVSTQKKFVALAGYLICNIGVTIYNKVILGPFPFPWLLTALHAGCSSIGCVVMLQLGVFRVSKLTKGEHLALAAFSLLFTINIAISNVSLAMVSVSFHQLVRATTPVFTTLLSRILYKRTFSRGTYLSLIPVVCGVLLATHGKLSFSDLGFILTLLGVVLAALKTIITNRIMTGGRALSFWEVLFRMSPLACAQSLVYAFVTGELGEFGTFVRDEISATANHGSRLSPAKFALIVTGNGALAFALNVSSFSTNKVAGALTMTVCGNVKQCLTVVFGSLLFDVHLSATNMWGILVTVVGGAVYSWVELDSRKRNCRANPADAPGEKDRTR